MEVAVERDTGFGGYDSRTPRYLRININGSVDSTPRRYPAIDYTDVYGGPPTRAPFHEALLGWDDEGNVVVNDCRPVFGFSEREGSTPRYLGEDFFNDIFKAKNSTVIYSSRKQESDSANLGDITDRPPSRKSSRSSNDNHFGDKSCGTTKREFKGTEIRTPRSAGLPVYSCGASSRLSHVKEMTHKRTISKSNESRGSSKEQNSMTRERSEDRDFDTYKFPSKNKNFHFSIYKWAGKGVPVSILKGVKEDEVKEKSKVDRCSSFNGWLHGESIKKGMTRTNIADQAFDSLNSDTSSSLYFSKELEKDMEATFVATKVRHEEEHIYEIQKKSCSTVYPEYQVNFKADEKLREKKKSLNKASVAISQGVSESNSREEEEEVPLANQPSVMSNNSNAVYRTINSLEDSKTNIDKSGQKLLAAVNGKSGTTNIHCSPNSLISANGKNKCGEKVKEFVKIFNQNAASRSVKTERRNICGKETEKTKTSDVLNATLAKVRSERYSSSSRKFSDSPIKGADCISISDGRKTDPRQSDTNFFSAARTSEEIAEYNNCFFLVEELPLELAKSEEESSKQEMDELQKIEDQVRRWCSGKENNIRSLLSTLHYALWPGSGWKAVPLVDIIEGNAVKKSYQKALLCLHPDKLQQKGAISRNKFIAEKVFDVLQEAWSHFNSLSAL